MSDSHLRSLFRKCSSGRMNRIVLISSVTILPECINIFIFIKINVRTSIFISSSVHTRSSTGSRAFEETFTFATHFAKLRESGISEYLLRTFGNGIPITRATIQCQEAKRYEQRSSQSSRQFSKAETEKETETADSPREKRSRSRENASRRVCHLLA